MSNVLADGTILSMADTYTPTPIVMSAASNATEVVVTLAAGHSCVIGDFVEVSSAWPGLDGKVLRVKSVATNDVTLEGFNTSDVTKYPAAGGAGTVRRILTWLNIAQVLTFTTSGGDQNYLNIQYLNETQIKQLPTSKNPIACAITLADDIKLAQQAKIRAADDGAVPVALRLVYRNGTRMVTNGLWSMAYIANTELGQVNKRAVSFALSSLPQEYAT